ncbi:MAG: primosomal protein N' [Clostridiaceae bacterium]|nr:primosomal protein N' [Clostridiaceae bacterium]
MDKKLFAEVIVANKCKETDRTYSYLIPKEMEKKVTVGSRVIVPFGMGNKQLEGYVLEVKDSINFSSSRLKSIVRMLDDEPVMSPELVELAKWMKEKYLSYYIDAIQTIVPSPVRTKSSYIIELSDSEDTYEKIAKLNSNSIMDIVEFIELNGGSVKLGDIKEYFSDRKIEYYMKKLLEAGVVQKLQVIGNKIGKKTEKLLYLNEEASIEIRKNAIKQKEIYEWLLSNTGISLAKLKEACGDCDSAVKAMEKKGYIKIVEKDEYRKVASKVYSEKRHELSEEQRKALENIRCFFSQGRDVVLHGVTGSGKTEVYLELIEECLSLGKDSIMLVPEISLTPQMVSRFKNRFGDNIAVLHSRLSEGEKYDEWRKIKAGIVKIAIGARSAVFAPFKALGLIIIDEEHEHTYKSETKPKYLTREVGEKRCRLEGANMLMGSATPSIETYYRARMGEIGLAELRSRVNGSPMPEVEVVDMREELKSGNKTVFSSSLTEAILDNLKSKDQMILFLNRRGHSTFVSCRQCGIVMKCPRCSISLTYHMKSEKLVCHYCGYERDNPTVCPKCKSTKIKYFGVGTQKLEKEFQKKFSVKNVLRMDADTTSKKNSHQEILDKYKRGESNVLIGTQMISKGLDFPDVTLVGVIAADTSLNLPDFRSAERTFQIITQVAGRSGRASKKGRVIVQTYNPEHYSIEYARYHDYKGFYEKEIMLRKELCYPPFSSIANIIISGTIENEVIKYANEISILLDADLKQYTGVEKLGPAAASISRIKNRFRWQIVIKSKSEEILRTILGGLADTCGEGQSNASISMDLNPQNMV